MSMESVTRTVLTDQPLSNPILTAHVEIRRISMPPGLAPGAHAHNGPVFGSIEHGSVIFQIGTEPEVTLRAGDIFYEPADTVITRFDATDEGVVFLGYFLLTEGQESELRPTGI